MPHIKTIISCYLDINGHLGISCHLGRVLKLLLVNLLLVSSATAASSENNTHETIPAALQDWVGWVQARATQKDCTVYEKEAKACAWPSPLHLDATAQGALFEQQWEVMAETLIRLPGNKDYWPTDILVNSKAVPVIHHKEYPAILLAAGQHTVQGKLSWRSMPQRLPIAPDTGLVELSINGKKTHPHNKGGVLWLQNQKVEKKNEADSLQIEVFRLLRDGEPMVLSTVIRLSVSGSPRELALATLLDSNSKTLKVKSELPLKIEDDGSIKLRARAGQWEITHHARLIEPQTTFSLLANNSRQNAIWAEQEIWGFAGKPQLRQVVLSGAPALDPYQINIPDLFRNSSEDELSLYLLDANTQLTLKDMQRGKRSSTNQLSLDRNIWLHFDGQGATFKDDISGEFQQYRLNVKNDLDLQSAASSTDDLVINEHDGLKGVEIRDQSLDLTAMGHIDLEHSLPANGWATRFNHARLRLHLPPGYKVWHLGGADSVSNTWISRWNLLNIFITLLIAGTLFKLYSWPLGLTAFFTGLLTYHSPNNIFILIAPFCLLLPLLKALPSNKLRTILQYASAAWAVIVLLNLIGFSTAQLRGAIYPQLAVQETPSNYYAPPEAEGISQAKYREADVAYEDSVIEEVAVRGIRASAPQYSPKALNAKINEDNFSQTGPATLNWQWAQVRATWQGGLMPEQTLSLWYTGPLVARLFYVLSTVLSVLLLLGIARQLIRYWQAPSNTTLGSGSGSDSGYKTSDSRDTTSSLTRNTLLICCLFTGIGWLTVPQKSIAQDYPSEALLNELEKRLNKKSACAPHCTAINQVKINSDEQFIFIELHVSALEESAFALPSAAGWQLNTIQINGKPAQHILKRKNTLYTLIPAGQHMITLAALSAGNTLNINFATTAHNITLNSGQWRTDANQAFAPNSRNVALERIQGIDKREQWGQPDIEAFVEVTRQITWGTKWQVKTLVKRIAPQTGSITLKLPLIEGEKVTSQNFPNTDKTITITLNANQNQVSWASVLAVTPTLHLHYMPTLHHTERWALDHDERWHAEASGLPAINDKNHDYAWQPRPNETLTLTASKPIAAKGSRQTIESLKHILIQGKRFIRHESTLNIKASTGSQFKIGLPANASQIAFILNDEDLHIEDTETAPNITLPPGDNILTARWQMPASQSRMLQAPELLLPIKANNITTKIKLSRDRWPLWLWGPRMGPAMLYWGLFATLLLCVVGLAAVAKKTRLSAPIHLGSWLLLCIGISSVHAFAGLLVVTWFFLLEYRKRYHYKLSQHNYNLMQIGIGLYTFTILMILLSSIPFSLLAEPNMHVTGQGSSDYTYNWYLDHHPDGLPQLGVFHVSLWVYRIAMLVWSIWLVFALIRWAKWFWLSFSEGGLWKETVRKPSSNKTSKQNDQVNDQVSSSAEHNK